MKGSTALRVKELLREKGWTTKVLAEKTGMSESYLTHIKTVPAAGMKTLSENSQEHLKLTLSTYLYIKENARIMLKKYQNA